MITTDWGTWKTTHPETAVLEKALALGRDANGADVGSHQAFWFAWSQFCPETVLLPE